MTTLRMETRMLALRACALLAACGAVSGCNSKGGGTAPSTLADQKAAVAGAPAPPGALKAIADAQAQQAAQAKVAQEHAKSGQAAAQAAAAAKGH